MYIRKSFVFSIFLLKNINETDLHPATSPTNQIMDEILTNVTKMEVCFMININL